MSETTAKVSWVDIDEHAEGQRIDNFLMRHLKGVPKGHVYRILRKGEVRVNKGRIKPTYRLKIGDQVRIPPVRLAERPENRSPDNLEWLESRILYEDGGLLVLDKPSGMAVHGGSGLSYGVIEALRALRPKAPYLELVHRLDRDTSGCLMIAKKRSALRHFHHIMRENQIDKRYLTLVAGRWHGGKRKVDVPLRKFALQGGERMVKVSPDGKPARSWFSPVTVWEQASLMQVKLDTGRTHQIRVHAAHSDHPIGGDEKYGTSEFNAAMRALGLKRLFLHAHSLRFELPNEGGPITVTAPLPPELEAVVTQLEQNV